jgi:hypothetical protein
VPEVLVMREDDYVLSQRSTHGGEASTSHATPSAPGIVVAHSEQGLCRADAPPAHFNEA